ncbi:unnamed protein product [Mytilus edulis]|uniref:EGF-like domain-containing protein n=1 Tax=Mytilus edulis TaxID=6550 RepID=A0A8S3TSG1_MYTED|nr:unnamed protein product [Mytilus edulis]
MNNDYQCACPLVFQGKHCEDDVDECQTQPCQRGGKCKNSYGSFNCDCYETGYTDKYCNVDLNECELSPCQNGGQCTNSDGDYNCSCTLGYEGKNCSNPNSDLVPSDNSGTCGIANNQWKYSCHQYYFVLKSDNDRILGVDRTFNLGAVFVTNFVYKNTKVIRKETGAFRKSELYYEHKVRPLKTYLILQGKTSENKSLQDGQIALPLLREMNEIQADRSQSSKGLIATLWNRSLNGRKTIFFGT